jgi:hypothetical protein
MNCAVMRASASWFRQIRLDVLQVHNRLRLKVSAIFELQGMGASWVQNLQFGNFG